MNRRDFIMRLALAGAGIAMANNLLANTLSDFNSNDDLRKKQI